MAKNDIDLPHLRPCKGCGVANGRNADRCWSCGADLAAGARKRVLSFAAARSEAGSPLAAASPPGSSAGSDPVRTRSSPRARARPLSTTLAIVLALAAVAAFWTPASERASPAQASSAGAVEPLQAGGLPMFTAATRRSTPAAPEAQRGAVAASETVAPAALVTPLAPAASFTPLASAAPAAPAAPGAVNARQAAWALGIAAEPSSGPAESTPGTRSCRDVDRAFGLCAAPAAATEPR
jgi:hypothetical protein